MARLSDVDALKEILQDEMKKVDFQLGEYVLQKFCDILDKSPTADAVPVVRCKDCEQWGGVAFGNVCRRWSAPLAGMKNCTGANDFCSYGERRTDDT